MTTPAAGGVEVHDLVTALVDELEARGVASGAWLVEIEQVRQSLRTADTLLLRMHDAIIRDAQRSSS